MTVEAKPRVLVADDERVIADTLVIILNQAGFEATAAYSGKEALDLADSLKPDMLISDVIMPDLSGIDAAITVRARHPSCKILLFSGQAATATCWTMQGARDMSSRYLPSRSTRRTFSRNSRVSEYSTNSSLKIVDCDDGGPLRVAPSAAWPAGSIGATPPELRA